MTQALLIQSLQTDKLKLKLIPRYGIESWQLKK